MSIYFKLSPELSDGITPEISNNKVAIVDTIKEWLDEFSELSGESFTVETVEMSEEAFNKLPEL